MLPTLDVVIVNWNTGQALADCVGSVAGAAAGVDGLRIVVVDNASSDTSMAAAIAAVPGLVAIGNAENRGFAAACNQGARSSTADYLLFLNPDTRLHPDALARVLAFMGDPARAEAGICGIRLVDEHGQPSTAAARFPTLRVLVGEATGLSRLLPWLFPRHLLTAAECTSTREVDQVIGAFFLVRRPLFERLGGFDERFFVYFEEVDLSYRAKQAGYTSWYLADAEAFHHGGLSSDQVKAARLFYSLRSRLLYADKHYARPTAWAVRSLTLGIERLARTLRARVAGGTAPAETAAAYARLQSFLATPSWPHARDAQRRP